MGAFWGKLTAIAATLALAAPHALAQDVIVLPSPGWADAVLGAALLLPAALVMIVWQRSALIRQGRKAQQQQTVLEQVRETLCTSPDGFFCWMTGMGEEGGRDVWCSRRLAVLLSLPKGTQADYADVQAAFVVVDHAALDQAVTRLRDDGEGFDMVLSLAISARRIRVLGVRAAAPSGDRLADILWMRDDSENAAAMDASERALTDSRTQSARLRALVDSLPMPVWLRDEDLSLLAANRAYASAVDVASADVVIHDQLELAADDLVREARALAAHARASGQPRSASFHLVLGGQRQLVSLTETPLQLGERRLTAGFAADQTRIEDLQDQIQSHMAAHGEVLERLSTAMAIFATDTRLTFFNTAFVRLWQLERDWLNTQPGYGEVLDALRERRLLPEAADYRAAKADELKRFQSLIGTAETLLHLPDGRTLRRMISAHPQGGLIYTYEDVTDTLAMERSFNTALAVQRETLDHLHEGIAVFGDDGRLKLYNPAFTRIWGLDSTMLAQSPHFQDMMEYFRPFFEGRTDRSSSWAAAHNLLSGLPGRNGATAEGRLERQDGMILDCSAVPLPDGAMLLTWLDVTDSSQVERALLERNEALAAADALKNEFIANVSAEVGKPLTTIVGFSDMLSAEYFGRLTPRQLEYVNSITMAGKSLQTLVSDILDLAAIEAGQMTLELDSVDIHPMLTSVLSLVRERVREKSLTLDFLCPLEIGWVVADQRRLRQVMFNLIGNAVKFTPPGGTVTVGCARQGADMVFSISDTGSGIPPEEQARIFNSFMRGNTPESGAGLGLALVRRFVELHGGQVELDSSPGQGTTIRVRLPASR